MPATCATGFQANPPTEEWVWVAATHSADRLRPDTLLRMAATRSWSASSRSSVTIPTRSSPATTTTARTERGNATQSTSGRTRPYPTVGTGTGIGSSPTNAPAPAAAPRRLRAAPRAPAVHAPGGGTAPPTAPPRAPGAPRASAGVRPRTSSCRGDGRAGELHADVPQPTGDPHVPRRGAGPALPLVVEVLAAHALHLG